MRRDLIDTFMIILCYLGYVCAVGKFCMTYLGTAKGKAACKTNYKTNFVCFVILIFSSSILLSILNGSGSVSIPYIFLALLNYLFFIGLIFCLFQGDMEKKLLVASVLIMARRLTINFCESIFSCIALLWLHIVKGIDIPVVSEQGMDLIRCAIYLVAAFVIYWMTQHLKSVFYCKTRRWYLMLSIPLLAMTAIIDVANWGAEHGIMVKGEGTMGLYYDEIFSYVGLCVLVLLSTFAAGFYIYGMSRISLEQQKSSQYYFQIAAYKMLEEQYSQSERLRHDMKNHILALLGLLENKEWKKAEDYLKNMSDSANLGSGEEITGNRVVDVLLDQSRQRAERFNIQWECDVQMPKECDIDAFDLCILFGNILDNAVEACERLQCEEAHYHVQPFINIQAGMVKKCLLLEVKNSSAMTENHKAKGINSIDERNAKGHGIGLLNIHDVVHKYNGIVNTELQNCVFTISVLIPLDNAIHDIKQVV